MAGWAGKRRKIETIEGDRKTRLEIKGSTEEDTQR